MQRGKAWERARVLMAMVWLVLASASTLFVACTNTGASENDNATAECAPGTAAACACADGTMSMQLCNADGAGFLACQCGGSTVSMTPSGSGGSSTATPVPSTTSDPAMPTETADAGTMPPVDPPADLSMGPTGLTTVSGGSSVGLEWDAVAGATGYLVYWSTTAGVTPTNAEGSFDGAPGVLHKGLVNGTTYYYVVTALTPEGESAPSMQTSATPAGEFVLQQLGTGHLNDIATNAPRFIPVEHRVNVVLAAEGYLANDLSQFQTDVDEWMADVFAVDPYDALRDAFVIWSLPRASAEHVPGLNTAFQVPISSGSVSTPLDATAATLWTALDAFPEPVTFGPMADNYGDTALNLVVALLIYDPQWGRAGFSGFTTSLLAPDGTRRVQAAFARGHVHEFTHAFARVRDEYMEYDNTATSTRETSNVVATNACSELPWSHLLAGSTVNPTTDQLVGAFGTATIGYHSELKCMMNGTHDNTDFYGGSGLLRTEDRLCNFCREITAFRLYERTQSVASFATWKSDFRSAFWSRFGFFVPTPVPQQNNVGDSFFEACVP